MTDSVHLINATLGLDPFVLLELGTDDDGDTSLKLKAGGGIESNDEITFTLLTALEAITGVDTALYIEQVNVVRRAAGLAPLGGAR
jgi:hypothetical protein